jgi:hypothetical protein
MVAKFKVVVAPLCLLSFLEVISLYLLSLVQASLLRNDARR